MPNNKDDRDDEVTLKRGNIIQTMINCDFNQKRRLGFKTRIDVDGSRKGSEIRMQDHQFYTTYIFTYTEE